MDQARESISEWFGRLKAGEADAAQRLWDRYSDELLRIAKQRLGNSPRGIADEEDVALSVFGSVCRAAAEGRFSRITTRDELWWLLLSITKRKAIDHRRRELAEKRHGWHARSEVTSEQISFDDLVSSNPTPDFLVALEEEFNRLLNLLRDERLREVAVLRIEGYTNAEIAQRMSISVRAIERKLQLIRTKWQSELIKSDRMP